MALEVGTKPGTFEIVAPIGKGGTGEVYRARYGKLGRDVAIKVLPDEIALDEERVRRFQREARVLASLNHPNIAAIYGFDESHGIHYLVLELVPGETLADRIARGPIPVDEALDIAGKIADALEAAHEQGIVHRDLKPANIKLTENGTVKVLDFGLAKALVVETRSRPQPPHGPIMLNERRRSRSLRRGSNVTRSGTCARRRHRGSSTPGCGRRACSARTPVEHQ